MLKRLEECGVLKQGHWKLRSGNHSNIYCNKDAINQHPNLKYTIATRLQVMVLRFLSANYTNIDDENIVITGPAIAGAIWAAPVAKDMMMPFVYPEKATEAGKDIMVFRRGYDKFLDGKKVVIVEDIISSGGSVRLTIDAVERCGGEVIYVAAIWNRTGASFKCSSDAIMNDRAEMWSHDECPLCKMNEPLLDPKTDKVIE